MEIASFYSQFISSNDLVFDIGATVGSRSEVFSRLARMVIAVEPQPGLLDKFKTHPNIVVVEKACGAQEGQAEMFIASHPGIDLIHTSAVSSLSAEYIDAVKKTKRHSNGSISWDIKTIVPLTTLDALIREYGIPSFIKIDVEGYEGAVFQGLTHQIKALSFEFTPEVRESCVRSLDKLRALGKYEFNYDTREKFILQDSWTDAPSLQKKLDGLPEWDIYGDVYARITTEDNRTSK